MRALVTGAGGFLGRRLVRDLAERGHEVTAMIRPSSAPPADLEAAGARILRADLRRPPASLAGELEGVDAIHHLVVGGGPTWRAVFTANVTTTENLLTAIGEAAWHGRLVHVSSFAVYALNQERPGALIDESTPLEQEPGRRDDYAWSKLLQERLLARLAGPEVAIVRPGAVYGPERRFQYRLGRPLGEGAVLLLGGGNRMPLTYVDNTASLVAECGEHPAAAGEVFNSVDPDPVTQLEYLRRWRSGGEGPRVIPVPLTVVRGMEQALQLAARRSAGRIGPPPFLDPYVMEPTFRRFRWDSSKPGRVLGWTPPVSTEEALRRTFAR